MYEVSSGLQHTVGAQGILVIPVVSASLLSEGVGIEAVDLWKGCRAGILTWMGEGGREALW